MANDYYKTLGVSKNASQPEIQKAYRDLARKYHPDMNPDDKTAKRKFQEIQTAFDVLNDPSKREMYDRYGSSFESAGGGARGPGGRSPGPGGMGGFEDAFSQFFGERYSGDPTGGFADIFSQFRRAKGGAAGKRGKSADRAAQANPEFSVQVPFQVAVQGGDTQLELRHPSGKVDTVSVKIPAGIEEGKKIRLKGRGADGSHPADDLLVTIHIAPHPCFQRRGDNLHVKLPITLREAARGAKVDVPTPRGTVSLRVPAGTSSGKKLRVKGHGVVAKGRPAGDLFAELEIILPASLDAEALRAIDEIDARHPGEPRGELQW